MHIIEIIDIDIAEDIDMTDEILSEIVIMKMNDFLIVEVWELEIKFYQE